MQGTTTLSLKGVVLNPLNAQLNPICKSQLAEFFCGYLNFAHDIRKKP